MSFSNETNAGMDELRQRLQELGWYHSIEVPGVGTIPGLQSTEQLQKRLAQFPIPQDLRGKRVLDIGAWDGWFSFEMERRGAMVIAMDNAEHHRFREAKKLLGSSVEYINGDICRVTSRDLGHFDYVLFFGVLYHLKHPLLALENVCELATEAAFIESYVCDPSTDPAQRPYMEFYEGDELAGQFDNWVGPNLACLLAMCRTAGFARVEFESVLIDRAHVSCYRKWKSRPGEVAQDLIITSAANASKRQTPHGVFSGNLDEYVNVWFKSGDADLTADTVFPVIGEYGSRPVHISRTGEDGYLLNCKLPPGLARGAHSVTLATASGVSVNQVDILVGATPAVIVPSHDGAGDAIEICTVADGISWARDRVSVTNRGGFLSLWAKNVAEGLSNEDAKVSIAGRNLEVSFISAKMPDGLTQINVTIPPDIPLGTASLDLVLGRKVATSTVKFYRPEPRES